MFNHPGNKIKGFAKFIFVLGVIASIVLAIMVFVTAGEVYSGLESMLIIAGILILIVGPILSWLSVLVSMDSASWWRIRLRSGNS